MSSLNTLTGRTGRFSVGGVPVARCTQWAVSPKLASTNEWGDSDSAGYTNRSSGRMDCTFTAEGKFDTGSEVWDLFQPGDIVAAILYMNVAALAWTFARALCQDFDLTVNIDTEEVLSWTSSWGADGVWTNPG